ncbi:substrate-binding periplasmic protein [Mangrovitalea sediminis]|uniref:substrate-binding periplasmic protein n=1 Tax=Mangrovitalea sediminis TaxID=1982043 RepID=UPI000BE4B7A2|nr:transporter substrate-binding domain-containing protein [Mangrovitalea sediminis]
MAIRTLFTLRLFFLTAFLVTVGPVYASTINYLVVQSRSEPFQVANAGKSAGGIITDIVQAVFAGSAYDLRVRVLPVNRLIFTVNKGVFNNWVAYDAKPWPHLKRRELLINEPLFRVHHVALTCRRDFPKLSSLRDLAGLQLAVLKHFDYLGLDKARQAGLVREVGVSDYESGIRMAALGRVDGFVEMDIRLRYHLKHWKGQRPTCLHRVDFSAIIPDYDIYLAVDRNMPSEDRRFISERLSVLKANGTIDRIVERYLGQRKGE